MGAARDWNGMAVAGWQNLAALGVTETLNLADKVWQHLRTRTGEKWSGRITRPVWRLEEQIAAFRSNTQ